MYFTPLLSNQLCMLLLETAYTENICKLATLFIFKHANLHIEYWQEILKLLCHNYKLSKDGNNTGLAKIKIYIIIPLQVTMSKSYCALLNTWGCIVENSYWIECKFSINFFKLAKYLRLLFHYKRYSVLQEIHDIKIYQLQIVSLSLDDCRWGISLVPRPEAGRAWERG